MTTYTKLPGARLEMLAAGGDKDAQAELARRSGAPVVREIPHERKARKLRGFNRPLTSSRYSWWPPQQGQPSFEMHEQSKSYWSAQREREHAQMKSLGYVVENPRLDEERG